MNAEQIQTSISNIIKLRKTKVEDISVLAEKNSQLSEECAEFIEKIENLESGVSSLEYQGDDKVAGVVKKVLKHCQDAKDVFKKIRTQCNTGNPTDQTTLQFQITQLKHRFEREKIDIGVAGGTQAGKSFTLCNMLGLKNEGVRSFFPIGGHGVSTTGANSCVCCIDDKLKETAVVEFFDWDAFRDNILKPFFDFFTSIKVRDDLLARFRVSFPSIPRTLTAFQDFQMPEKPSFGEKVPDPEYNAVWTRLAKLIDARKDYIENLREASRCKSLGEKPKRDIRIDEVFTYAAYPDAIHRDSEIKGDEQFGWLCPSVKMITGKIVYPNCIAKDCDFFDLPGKNELGALDVAFRYRESFNLEKDIIFYVRRYDPDETLTGELLGDLGEIIQKLPDGVLSDYVPIFLNIRRDDQKESHSNVLENKLHFVRNILFYRGAKYQSAVAGVQAEDGKFVYYKVFNCKHLDKDKLQFELCKPDFSDAGPVIFIGDAASKYTEFVDGENREKLFVQDQLLPALCQFVAQRTQRIDDACIANIQDAIADLQGRLEIQIKDLKDKIRAEIKKIPGSEDEDENTWAEQLRPVLFNTGTEVFGISLRADAENTAPVQQRESFEPLYKRLIKDIEQNDSGLFIRRNRQELRDYIAAEIDFRGARLVEETLIQLRRGLLKSFSSVQAHYEKFISDQIDVYFGRVRKAKGGLPFLEWNPEKPRDALRAWKECLEKAECGNTLLSAARDLLELKLDYYVAVYPDLRASIYAASIDKISRVEFDECVNGVLPKEQRVDEFVEQLKGMAEQWLNQIYSVFSGNARNESIIKFAFERFIDETCNSPSSMEDATMMSSKSELLKFCSAHLEKYREYKNRNTGDNVVDKIRSLVNPLMED